MDYKDRNDFMAKIFHQELALKVGFREETTRTPFYKYILEAVPENNNYRLYWVLTDQMVAHNNSNMIIVDQFSRQAIFVDIAVANSFNLLLKHKEKLQKYRRASSFYLKGASRYPGEHPQKYDPFVFVQVWEHNPGGSHSFKSSQPYPSAIKVSPAGHRHIAPTGVCLHPLEQRPPRC